MLVLIAIVLGGVSGYFQIGNSVAFFIGDVFMRLIRLMSIPVIFFAILSTFLGLGQLKKMGKKVLSYTMLTTILSASVALVIYNIINPCSSAPTPAEAPALSTQSYYDLFMGVVPQNWLEPFLQSNVMAVMFLSLMLGAAFMQLPEEHRKALRSVVEAIFQSFMIMVKWFIKAMPLAIWAFVVMFISEVMLANSWHDLASYMVTISSANLIQGVVVLPLFLLYHRINPLRIAREFSPALSFAFFSKSSVATLPVVMDCAIQHGVKPQVARFCYPLCTSINMNACAAFIIVTVMFVASQNGVTFTIGDQILWVGISTLAAIGNAGVPMGCFFMASSLLSVMGVPIHMMGLILPFYTMLDMLETAINIWSDSCVTCVVDKHVASDLEHDA